MVVAFTPYLKRKLAEQRAETTEEEPERETKSDSGTTVLNRRVVAGAFIAGVVGFLIVKRKRAN